MRRIQIFTRLTPRQEELLVDIGWELHAKGVETVKQSGEINTSEVIRVLLARADNRFSE